MKLKLHRAFFGKNSTLGELYVDGLPECFILEDTDRQLEVNPDAKVHSKTCIPRGEYKIIITWSNRFNKELPLLVDVPGYSGVRIHPGNTHENTEGCLLPGTSYAKSGDDYIVQNSRNAFFKLNQKIESAIDKGETVSVEIT